MADSNFKSKTPTLFCLGATIHFKVLHREGCDRVTGKEKEGNKIRKLEGKLFA